MNSQAKQFEEFCKRREEIRLKEMFNSHKKLLRTHPMPWRATDEGVFDKAGVCVFRPGEKFFVKGCLALLTDLVNSTFSRFNGQEGEE